MSNCIVTRTFMSGRSEAIRIPKEFRFGDRDVVINKVGCSLVITAVDDLEESFLSGLSMLGDDFMADGRPDEVGSIGDNSLDIGEDKKNAG